MFPYLFAGQVSRGWNRAGLGRISWRPPAPYNLDDVRAAENGGDCRATEVMYPGKNELIGEMRIVRSEPLPLTA